MSNTTTIAFPALWGMKQKKARTTHGHRPAGGPLAFGP